MNFETFFAVSADPYYYAALVVDFVILFALLVLVRQIFGRTAGGVDTAHELSEKDNHAFGVSLAGATVALSVVFAGVAAGDVATSLMVEAIFVFGYGVLGIVFLFSTRLIFDKISFPKTDLKKLIADGNVSAGILDGGNMIASAVVIFGVFSWANGDWLASVVLVIGMFIITQLLLVVASRYRVGLFAKRNDGQAFCDAIEGGNSALAIRFAGFQIGIALAISVSGAFVVFQEGTNTLMSIGVWVVVAVVLLIVATILTVLVEKVVLHGIPVSREVDREKNYGVASVEAGAYIGLGLLLVSLLS
ncbi:hypothetical protein A9Q83_00370 [Alphaproteobacteria bacterium 46_93_T64]|nr:hypothetical protein A9Q83_00370 [Alphaproteobacteria bacterium 46_93_T64]